jgi:hypothetical protein
MRIRAVIAGLALLALLFCSVSQGQAANSLRHNIHNNPPAGEHPWQHGGAPDPGDDPDYRLVPSVIIIPGVLSVQAVVLIQTPSWVSGQGEKAASRFKSEKDENRFQGTR